MSTAIAAFGALFTGLGSLVSALLGMRAQRKKSENECDARIAEVKRAFVEGLEYDEAKRWTHLP